MTTPPRPLLALKQIFRTPLLIAVVSLAGLVAALTGDGLRDGFAWLALGVPVAAVAWAINARRL